MFYVADKMCLYPSKTILEDVLSRGGAPDENSFTPYYGMRDVLIRQFAGNQGELSIKDFLQTDDSKDFDPRRVNTGGVEKGTYWRLEDIKPGVLVHYIEMLAVSYKKHDSGMEAYTKYLETTNVFVDENDGELVTEAELVDKDVEVDSVTLLQAQEKLPFLMKKLHQGSVAMGVSLMSFIIAKEQIYKHYFERTKKTVFVLKPEYFYNDYRTYAMNPDGTIGYVFKQDDNKVDKFRNAIKWIKGEMPNDQYYRWYQELKTVCGLLDYDLAEQDPFDYQADTIEEAECLYVASNIEYLETDVYGDVNIINAIRPDKLDKIQREFLRSDNVSELSRVEIEEASINRIAVSVPTNKMLLEAKAKSVSRALELIYTSVNRPVKTLSSLRVDNGVVCTASTGPLKFDASRFLDCFETGTMCVLTANGWIVPIEQPDVDGLQYVDIEHVSSFKKDGYYAANIEYTRISD